MRPQTFIRTFIKSISEARYYQQVIKAPFGFSLRFFMIGLVIIGLISGTIITIRDRALWLDYIEKARQELVTHYPEDLELAWNGSELTSTQELVKVTYPSFIDRDELGLPEYAAIINTQTQTLPEENRDALITIDRQNMNVRVASEFKQSISLKNVLPVEPLRITKSSIDNQSRSIQAKYVRSLLNTFSLASIIVFVVVLVVSRFLTTALESILMYIVMQLLNKKMRYRSLWQISLHVLIPAELINQVALILMPESTFPVFSLSFWTLMGYVLLSL